MGGGGLAVKSLRLLVEPEAGRSCCWLSLKRSGLGPGVSEEAGVSCPLRSQEVRRACVWQWIVYRRDVGGNM